MFKKDTEDITCDRCEAADLCPVFNLLAGKCMTPVEVLQHNRLLAGASLG